MATFKSVVTTLGQARIAAAIQSGKDINITHMAVGDGGGKPTQPGAAQTKLIKETYRTLLNSLKLDAKNANWIIAEAIISASVGGFWMREMGLYADDGVLIAVCNLADTYKPTLAEGSGRTQTLRMVITVTETEAVSLTMDDTLIVATEEYVNDLLAAHEKSRNHPDGTLTDKGFVQLSSATNSSSETLAATPKAVKTANDNANTRLPSDGTAVAADKLAKARKIAGVAFDGTQDVNLTPDSVGALPSGGTAVAATKLATARKIAGVAFDGSKDINLTAANVGAVQQGGGVGMSTNVVRVGWNGTKLLAQVDSLQMGALYSEYNKPTSADVGALPAAGGDAGYVDNAAHYRIKPGVWEGAGAYASQYANNIAPFMVPKGFVAMRDASQYHPIIKGTVQTQEFGYDTAISFGALTSGAANFAQAAIHVIGDNGTSQAWTFNPADGAFRSGGDIVSGLNIVAGGGVYESGGAVRAYSPNYRPTPNDIGAIARDTCTYAGFASGDPQSPYMRNSNNNEVVVLARQDWTRGNFATIAWANNDLRNDIYNWVSANFVSRAVGGVGSMTFARINTQNRSTAYGDLISGGELSPSGVTGYPGSGGGNWAAMTGYGSLAGTWQCMGYCVSDTEGGNRHYGTSLFMRVS